MDESDAAGLHRQKSSFKHNVSKKFSPWWRSEKRVAKMSECVGVQEAACREASVQKLLPRSWKQIGPFNFPRVCSRCNDEPRLSWRCDHSSLGCQALPVLEAMLSNPEEAVVTRAQAHVDPRNPKVLA
eukprot:1917943-Amphidinium_carterae.1